MMFYYQGNNDNQLKIRSSGGKSKITGGQTQSVNIVESKLAILEHLESCIDDGEY